MGSKAILYSLFASFIILICISNNSPILPQIDIDSEVFKYAGRALDNGFLPYLDFFDHKGPIIFLLNYIGIKLHIDYGVFFLEIISLTIVFYLFFCLETSSIGRLFVFLILIYLINNSYDGGNLTETYALPILLMCNKFVVDDSLHGFRLKLFVLLNIVLILIKPTYFIVFPAFLFVLLFFKKWRLTLNVLNYFLLSILFTLLIIWFNFGEHTKNLLIEYINTNYVFNFKYVSSHDIISPTEKVYRLFKWFFKVEVLLAIIPSVVLISNFVRNGTYRNFLNLYFILLFSAVILTVIMPFRFYRHYNYLFVLVLYNNIYFTKNFRMDLGRIIPYLSVFAILEILSLSDKIQFKITLKNAGYKYYDKFHSYKGTQDLVNFLKFNKPTQENTNLANFYVLDNWCYIYNATNTISDSKYFYPVLDNRKNVMFPDSNFYRKLFLNKNIKFLVVSEGFKSKCVYDNWDNYKKFGNWVILCRKNLSFQ
jgi:hypothetical protein